MSCLLLKAWNFCGRDLESRLWQGIWSGIRINVVSLVISGRPCMVRYVESIWLQKMVRLLLKFLSSSWLGRSPVCRQLTVSYLLRFLEVMIHKLHEPKMLFYLVLHLSWSTEHAGSAKRPVILGNPQVGWFLWRIGAFRPQWNSAKVLKPVAHRWWQETSNISIAQSRLLRLVPLTCTNICTHIYIQIYHVSEEWSILSQLPMQP